MRGKEEAYRILETALSLASSGVDEAEVALQGGVLGVTKVAKNQLHPSIEVGHEKVSVRVIKDGCSARAATSDLSTEGITQAAQRARADLERLPGSLGDDSLPAPQTYQDVDGYDEATAQVGSLERTAIAARAITAAYKAYGKQVLASGEVAVGRGCLGRDGVARTYALANTRGLVAYHPATLASFEVRLESGARRGRAYRASHALDDLDPAPMVEAALWKATHGHRLATLPPGRYTAILEPAAVAALVRLIGVIAGAERLNQGASFMTGRRGDRVFDEQITIVDNYRHVDHCGSPFDADGVARQVVPLIEQGVVRGPVVAWSTSLRCGLAATGHRVEGADGRWAEGARHLVMDGGGGGVDRLISATRAGVLVSGFEGVELLDARTLRVTGSTAYGTFAIESGEIGAPVGDLRFDVSLVELLSMVIDMGEPEWAEGAVVPPLKVSELPLYAPT